MVYYPLGCFQLQETKSLTKGGCNDILFHNTMSRRKWLKAWYCGPAMCSRSPVPSLFLLISILTWSLGLTTHDQLQASYLYTKHLKPTTRVISLGASLLIHVLEDFPLIPLTDMKLYAQAQAAKKAPETNI